MIVCADGVATVKAGDLHKVHKHLIKSSGIHTLVVEDEVAEQLPEDVNWQEFKDLHTLELHINMPRLHSLPDMTLPETLKVLSFRGCCSLTALPFNTCVMDKNLEVLDLTDCSSLTELPNKTCELHLLQELVLKGCSTLETLPVKFYNLRKLTMLDLRGCSSLKGHPTWTSLVPGSALTTSNSSLSDDTRAALTDLETIKLDVGSPSWECIQEDLIHWSGLASKLVLEVGVSNYCQDDLRTLWSEGMPAGIKGLVIKNPSLLPDDLQWSRFTNLQQLDISNLEHTPASCRQVLIDTDCDAESNVSGSTSGTQYHDCSSKAFEAAAASPACSLRLPTGICQLSALTELDISGWSELQELPAGLPHRLTKLEKLNLRGCSAIERLPQGFESFKELTHLDLSGCKSLKYLPHQFGDRVKGLKNLTHLDLSGCTSLEVIPESLVKMKGLQSLKLQECGVPHSLTLGVILSQIYLRRRVTFHDGSPQWQLLRVGTLLQQQAAVLKLARQQEPMLTTLERMSWLVVLLATATFMAYLQPPGGFESSKVPYYEQAESCLARLHNRSTPITDGSSSIGNGSSSLGNGSSTIGNGSSSQSSLRNQTAQGSGNQTARDSKSVQDWESRACAAAAYYVFDGLSFGLSVGCVMTIVVLSMPRMQWADNKAEAGRFYLLLLLTWVLLYLAVTTGLCTFIASGLVSHGNPKIVLEPVGPGIALVGIGLGLLIRRFRSLFPGWDALRTVVVFTWSWADRELRPVEDTAESGQDRFWRYCFHKLPREPETFSAGGLPVTVIADSSVQLASRGTLGMVFPQR